MMLVRPLRSSLPSLRSRLLPALIRPSSTLIGENSNLYDQSSIEQQPRPADAADDQGHVDHARRLSKTEIYNSQYPGVRFDRALPRSHQEFLERRRMPVLQPDDPRHLRVAVLGMPNAGKSTLTNQLIGKHVSAVSSRVHTTRSNITGLLVQDNVQIEFWDTPGIVLPKHCRKDKLETSFLTGPVESSRHADLMLVVVDAANRRYQQRLNEGLLRVLRKYEDKESILVLNKIDCIKAKQRLIDISTRLTNGIVDGQRCYEGDPLQAQRQQQPYMSRVLDNCERRLKRSGTLIELGIDGKQPSQSEEEQQEEAATTDGDVSASEQFEVKQLIDTEAEPHLGWDKFSQVFMVSALDGDGVDDLRQFLLDKSIAGRRWRYDESTITPQSPKKLVLDIVREKLLDYCPQEVPYETKLGIESWVVTAVGTLCVSINLWASTDTHMSIILGAGGQNISRIADGSRQVMANTFECDVALKLLVKKVRKKRNYHN